MKIVILTWLFLISHNAFADNSKINFIILGGGKATRMKSSMPKMLNKLAGVSMLDITYNTLKENFPQSNITFVTNEKIFDKYQDLFPKFDNIIMQNEAKGTAHAVKIALEDKSFNTLNPYTIVLFSDTPLKNIDIIKANIDALNSKYEITLAGFYNNDKNAQYGKIFVKNDNNHLPINSFHEIDKVKEFADFKENEKKPQLSNSAIVAGRTEVMQKLVPLIDNHNKKQEFILTYIIDVAKKNKHKTGVIIMEKEDALGANTKSELAQLEELFQKKILQKHLHNGVTIISPKNTYIGLEVEIGKDVTIEPHTYISGKSKIKDGSKISAFSYIDGCEVGDTKPFYKCIK